MFSNLGVTTCFNILTYLYLNGTTFFTLGLGDITPNSELARVFLLIEVASGFGFLALVISYAPVLYQAFSRWKQRISLLDARDGSLATATEFLCGNCSGQHFDELRTLLHEWEVWCADILESHLSYPVLGYYRSQHTQQFWVEALTVILDTCALILTGIEDIPVEPARFAFALSRHTVVDLAQVFWFNVHIRGGSSAHQRICPCARSAYSIRHLLGRGNGR